MTLTQRILTIAVIVLGTMLTRFLPFLLFPAGKPTPKAVHYLGSVLPGAVLGLASSFSWFQVRVIMRTPSAYS